MKTKKSKNQINSLQLLSSDDSKSVFARTSDQRYSKNNDRSNIMELIVNPLSIQEFEKLSDALQIILEKRRYTMSDDLEFK